MAKKTVSNKMQFQLFVVYDGIEPSLIVYPQPTWKDFEKEILSFLEHGDYDETRDGIFWAELNGEGKLVRLNSFSSHFMDAMKKKVKRGMGKKKG